MRVVIHKKVVTLASNHAVPWLHRHLWCGPGNVAQLIFWLRKGLRNACHVTNVTAVLTETTASDGVSRSESSWLHKEIRNACHVEWAAEWKSRARLTSPSLSFSRWFWLSTPDMKSCHVIWLTYLQTYPQSRGTCGKKRCNFFCKVANACLSRACANGRCIG